jgi:peptide/nickel transport system permease protein
MLQKRALLKLLFSKSIYLMGMLLLISLISFLAVQFAPNSFLASGELNPNITAEVIEQQKKIYGLDKPLLEQYVTWISSLVNLEFGISFSSGKMVSDEILERLPITLIINLISLLFVFVISLYLGTKAALNISKMSEKVIKQVALISYSLPSFYLALILIWVFAVSFNILPISGLHSVLASDGFWVYYSDYAWHLILPIGVIVFGGIGSLTLYIRSLTIEILKSDYIYFAKSRGLSDKTIFYRFILPNLSPLIITILGLSLPGLIGGSIILESIFSINGMGLLFYQAALSRDYPVIMGILMIGAFLTLLGNMIADLLLLKFNPYFKREKES